MLMDPWQSSEIAEQSVDPAPLFSADILEDEFKQWVEDSHLLKRAFREVAVIGGLVERQHPGKRKTGKQVTFSTDLIYDVLRKYEPDHLLLKAAWEDAKARMTELGRLARLVDRAQDTMVHVAATRVTPLAVPLMVVIGREQAPGGAVDEEILKQAVDQYNKRNRPKIFFSPYGESGGAGFGVGVSQEF